MGPTMQQNQQSRDHFNRSMNQRTQDFQMRQLQKNRSVPGMPPANAEDKLQAQANQQKAEQEANEQLTRLAQEQQRKREERPAKNPQQAAAQLKEDQRQLTLLTVKNYRDVFLPGQYSTAMEARTLSPASRHSLDRITARLMEEAWWGKQEGSQLPAIIKSYSDSLASLATGLMGFDLASPPPTPAQLTGSRVDELLEKGTFNQQTAWQIMQEVGMAEKLIAGDGVVKAVLEFQELSSANASNQALQSNPKKLQKEVQARLSRVNSEMLRYETRIGTLGRLPAAQKTMHKSTSTFLAKKSS
ncbi:hypothetical protein GCM10023185_16090 [Hymenobacter saemangeumensis]|uniref:Uncharacterized protein n=2 Tax=Hymenobacter saemangeumensis TaxID=1084522 RepID=A0ABP8I9Q5_9BACT